MRNLLFACPMDKEAAALNALLAGRIEVISTGIGIKRTLPALLAHFRRNRPELLIFTGSATQLDPTLNLKEVVLAEEWCLETDRRCFAVETTILLRFKQLGWATVPRALTLSRPVMRPRHRKELHESTGASHFDSVTAAVLRIAATEGIPCIAPKIIANTPKSGLLTFWQDLERNLAPLARYLLELRQALVVP